MGRLSIINLSIRGKLWVSFVLIIMGLTFISIDFFYITKFFQIGGINYATIKKQEKINFDISTLEIKQNQVRISVLVLASEADKLQMYKLKDQIRLKHREIITIFKNSIGSISNQKIKALLRDSRNAYLKFSEVRDNKVVPLLFSEKRKIAKTFIEGKQAALYKKLRFITRMANISLEASIFRLEKKSIKKASLFRDISIFVTALLIIIFGYLQYSMSRSVNRSIEKLNEGAIRIGTGDLSFRFKGMRNDEMGSLAKTINTMTEGLAESTVSIGHLTKSNIDLETAQVGLEAANTKLLEFTNMVCHDGRAPLRSIKNFLQFVYEDIEPKLSEDNKADFKRINLATHRMDSFFVDLQAYSKAGDKSKDMSPVDLNFIAQEVMEDISVALKEHDGVVNFHNLPKIMGSLTEVRSVFQNLISNSLKYKKGNLSPVVDVSWRQSGDGWADIIFTDNGCGFDAEFATEIFEPFKRLKTSNKVDGTGLGLSTVKKLVTFLGGTISANSEPGVGSTFVVRLKAV